MGAHDGHGPHDPTTSTPAVRPGSVRRTTNLDALRPDGVDGRLLLDGQGWDTLAVPDGDRTLLDHATLRIGADSDRRTLTEAGSSPSLGLAALVGGSCRGGFRRAVGALPAAAGSTGSALRQLLDDVPVVALISGQAEVASRSAARRGPGRERLLLAVDVCAGWASDATMMQQHRAGRSPVVEGPRAPDLPDELDGHVLPRLGAGDMRRRRRIDVWRDGGDLHADAFFRDSYVPDGGEDEGIETVIHEYVLRAQVAPSSMTLVDIVATPRVLPWQECPMAAASVERLVGRPLGELRSAASTELTGTSTCTHLTDLARCLADVERLAAHILGRSGPTS